jgi:hypothetical protein
MFGKILVCIHLAMSLLLATWALTLYTNRIDWTDRAAKGAEPEGLFLTKKKEYEALSKSGFWPADERYRTNRIDLESHEAARPIERPWYAQQIDFLNSGADEKNPVRQVDRDGSGNPLLVPNPAPGAELLQMGIPKDEKGNPVKGRDGGQLVLKSFDYYNKEYDTTLAQETLALRRRQGASARDLAATNKLKGPKGLHARLFFEVAKQELLKDEYNEVRPMWLNTMVELRNLDELRLRLVQRIDELEKLKSKGDRLGK